MNLAELKKARDAHREKYRALGQDLSDGGEMSYAEEAYAEMEDPVSFLYFLRDLVPGQDEVAFFSSIEPAHMDHLFPNGAAALKTTLNKAVAIASEDDGEDPGYEDPEPSLEDLDPDLYEGAESPEPDAMPEEEMTPEGPQRTLFPGNPITKVPQPDGTVVLTDRPERWRR